MKLLASLLLSLLALPFALLATVSAMTRERRPGVRRWAIYEAAQFQFLSPKRAQSRLPPPLSDFAPRAFARTKYEIAMRSRGPLTSRTDSRISRDSREGNAMRQSSNKRKIHDMPLRGRGEARSGGGGGEAEVGLEGKQQGNWEEA